MMFVVVRDKAISKKLKKMGHILMPRPLNLNQHCCHSKGLRKEMQATNVSNYHCNTEISRHWRGDARRKCEQCCLSRMWSVARALRIGILRLQTVGFTTESLGVQCGWKGGCQATGRLEPASDCSQLRENGQQGLAEPNERLAYHWVEGNVWTRWAGGCSGGS